MLVHESGELRLLTAPAPQRIDVLYKWFPRIALAGVFLMIGESKFDPTSFYVRIFQQIGFGDWFRYLTGALQIGGAILVLIPRTFLIGIAVLACTMVGAVLAWILFLGDASAAPIPGILLVIILAVGFHGRRQ
jgi:putative oxidoreductase